MHAHQNDMAPEVKYREDGPFFLTLASMEEENAIRIWSRESWTCLASYALEEDVSYCTQMFITHIFIEYDIENLQHCLHHSIYAL